MNKLVLAFFMAGSVVAGAASAQDAPPPGPRGGGMMMRADANGDGRISRDEYTAQVTARFARRDTNKDGFLSGDELAGPRGGEGDGGRSRMQLRADADNDGKVSQAEELAAATARFDRLDANKDGFLDAAEMSAMRGRFGPRAESPAGQ